MDDHQIIELFLNQDQTAIDQAERQYGNACRAVAGRILGNGQTAEAVVREAMLRAWDTIPQKQPKNLNAWLLRTTRNLTVDHAPPNGEYNRVLRELDRCLPGLPDGSDVPPPTKVLRRAIDEFLIGLSPAKRRIFVLRYWYLCSVEEIADRCGCSTSRVHAVLKQVRTQLREFLLRQELSSLSADQLLRCIGSIRDRWILEAGEAKGAFPMWVKVAILGVAVCCIVALGVFLSSQQQPPEETKPPQASTVTPGPSTISPVVSTTVPTTTAPTEEPTEPPQTESTAVEPSIQDSAAYQKLLSLENADQFDASVLEAFAQWIENEKGFMKLYPEKWKLTEYAEGGADLTCHSPLSEDYSCHFYRIWSHDDGGLLVPETGERYFTNIPREEIAAKVYSAEDRIGVSDEMREQFVDFIMDSDWFPWSTMDPEFRTEWYFDTKPYGESQTEHPTLFVEVWMPGMSEDDYVLCSLFHNGKEIRNGTNDTGFRGGIISSSWDNNGG